MKKKPVKDPLAEMIRQLVEEQVNSLSEQQQQQQQQQQQAAPLDVDQRVAQALAALQSELHPVLRKHFRQLTDIQKEIKDAVTMKTMNSASKLSKTSEELRRWIRALQKL